MIIKTIKGTYYVNEMIKDDKENDILIFKGFKNLKSIKKIIIRTIRLKKQFIIGTIDLKKTIVFIKNKEDDIRRLMSINLLINLNKDGIDFLPCTYREFIKIYDNTTRKYYELD